MSLTEVPKTAEQGNIFLAGNGDDDGFYNAENQRRLRESIRQAEEGRITEHELIGDDA
ncbi:MAG: hypothetical protein LBH00_06750 [Planctomycetaceae bacterium]|jgi:hypothetical protein|nr:hypothetical protein [Planctomycetaceae bacterium]